MRAALDAGVPITARGAGTSCAGNAVGPGLVIDVGRHLTTIHSIDPETRTAVIDPGVVQDQLQIAARHGVATARRRRNRRSRSPAAGRRSPLGEMI